MLYKCISCLIYLFIIIIFFKITWLFYNIILPTLVSIFREISPKMTSDMEATSRVSLQNNSTEDCLGCRLVSGGGLMAASVYVAYHAARNTHPVGRVISFICSGGKLGSMYLI